MPRRRVITNRRRPVKAGGLNLQPRPSGVKLKPVMLIIALLVGSFTLLAIHPPVRTNNTANQVRQTVSQPKTKEESTGAELKSTDKAEDYFSDILSKSESSGFNFTSSDLNLSSNTDFTNELNSSYGTSNFCNYGCHVYDSSGNYVTITCYGSTNSCTTYSSGGGVINTYCSSYTSSCNSYSSNGDYYNTTCSSYTSSCHTTGSDGYYSNSYCSSYTSSCSTYDSSGGYSNTYCSQYTSSCNTYGSDGSSSTTYCSQYTYSCRSY